MLLFFDGFETTFAAEVFTTTHGTKYASGSNGAGSSNFRTGSKACSTSGPPTLISKTYSPSGDAVMGMALYKTATPSAGTNIMEVREGTTVHMAVDFDGSNHLRVKRGSTVLDTGSTVLANGSYNYIEFKCNIHDTTGSYELRIDGSATAELSASGIDTRNGGSGTWDNVRWSGHAHDNSGAIDDVYLCDTSGSTNNDFLGAIRVYTKIAVADSVGAGANSDFTPSTGADNGAMVDETRADGDTTYNLGVNVGDKDTYQLTALGSSDAILGIQVCTFVKKTDVTARTTCNVVRSGGVDYDQSTFTPTTTYGYAVDVLEDDPDISAAWTEASVDAMEAGHKVVS